MPLFRYEAYGLRISSDLELPLRRGPVTSDVPDVIVRSLEPVETPTCSLEAEDSTVVASYESETGRFYVAVLDSGTYWFRFRGCGEFAIDSDLATIRCQPEAGGRSDLLPIMFAGTVLAFLLTLRGHLVLHASAVSSGGRALAFAGQSGRGKSTLAALTAALGARIVTDDVLLVDVDGGPRCRGNAGELRLRPAAQGLAASFGKTAAHRVTADERLAVLPQRRETGWVQLGAIVVPHPSRDAEQIDVETVSPSDAMLSLLAFPRVHGIRPRDLLNRQFTLLGQLVRTVPVYNVVIPWGPPFDREVATGLLGLLQERVNRERRGRSQRGLP